MCDKLRYEGPTIAWYFCVVMEFLLWMNVRGRNRGEIEKGEIEKGEIEREGKLRERRGEIEREEKLRKGGETKSVLERH